MNEEEPFEDLEKILASIAHFFIVNEKQHFAKILSRSDVTLDREEQTEWEDGDHWKLILEISYPIYVKLSSEEKAEFELDINNVIEPFKLRDWQHISAKIKPRPSSDLDWRKRVNDLKGCSAPSISLQELIKGRDIPSIDVEFVRALDNVNSSPRDAVSASCNILESIFKVYITDEKLSKPKKQDLQGLWKIVRSDLGFETSRVEDEDLKRILSGMLSVVDGIGAFRTHASSAHGQGRKVYKIKPRHARLAVHSAHTLALFVLEAWDEKNKRSSSKESLPTPRPLRTVRESFPSYGSSLSKEKSDYDSPQ